ncbi:MAG: hypothetical protein MR711_10355 [Selenomonas sp.]|uniref:hypothetical protein n=1 Tax=Selenomonas sp. TaxID=2053611 RepID=UPI0025DC29F8|nr:hypothetical protein [Selenomonas sp.]MCI6086625.1 hypothetical protein [Selenomonas sp.]MDY4415105.1 hypothetical protein [Selenomonas sp.]
MAKRGQKIDELYLSLGLDIAQLQLDFDTAGKTVSQAMARLNSKETRLKLRMDIDLAKLEGAGTELDKLKVKYEAINRQLDVQKQKEQVLAAVLKDAQKTSGMDSGAASRAETNLLKQQRIVAQTEAELRRLGKEYANVGQQMNAAGRQAGTFGARMQRGIAQAHTGLTKLSNGFSLLNAKTAAVMAALSTGASGNDTTAALERFGVTIQDQQGNLLPLNEQLAQLAKGYQYAVDMGQEEAYTAEVLGARGAALVPLLEQYQDLMQISANVQTTGLLNPEESHKTWLEWKQMEMELGQLKGAIGAALLPVSKELMPEVTEAFRALVQEISEHKDDIKEAILGWGTALKGVAEIATFVGEQIKKVSDHAKANAWLVQNHPMAGPLIGLPFIGGAVLDEMYGDEYQAYLKEQEALKEKEKAEKKATDAAKDNKNAAFENATAAKRRAEAEKQAAKATEEAAKANDELTESLYTLTHNELEASLHAVDKEIEQFRAKGADVNLLDEYKVAKQAKIYEDFQRNVVDATQAIYRTDLENKLANIDREAAAYRQKGLDEVSATEWAEASKAQVMQAFESDVASKVDAVWKTELQNRLDDIEREKQAWMQKGLDEVKATQWAEKEKLDAKRNAALQVLQSQKEEFRAYLEGGQRGLADYYKKAHGFTMDDLQMTPEQLAGFQQARQTMLENLLPNFRDPAVIQREREAWEEQYRANMEANGYAQAMDGTFQPMARAMDRLADAPIAQGGADTPAQPTVTDNRQVTVQVSIENAVTADNEGMRYLADQVADRIEPAVKQALGDGENTYRDW